MDFVLFNSGKETEGKIECLNNCRRKGMWVLGPTFSRMVTHGLSKTKGGKNKLFFSILFGIIALLSHFSSQQLLGRAETGKNGHWYSDCTMIRALRGSATALLSVLPFSLPLLLKLGRNKFKQSSSYISF